MIPTQCPTGQDPRMCAYCAHKDTCANRCDLAKCDIVWGEISGDLTDQTDLAAEIASVRSEIVKANSFSQVRLNIIDENLYVVAPVGLLNADADKPVFARYVKSTVRVHGDGRGSHHYKRSGWIRPMFVTAPNKKYPYVPMIMEKATRWDSNVYDYFVVKSGASDFQNTSRTYTDKVAKDIEVLADNKAYDIKFLDKRLGLCIERNGVQATNYLPFSTVIGKNGHYYLSRWNTGGLAIIKG